MPETVLSRPSPGPAELLALADRCVQCGLCLPHCPTYRLDAAETESPRGRIAYMKAVAAGSLSPTALGDLHLDHCLGCRRCEGACPAGVEYGALLLAGRAAGHDRRGRGFRRAWHLWLLARPRLLSALLRVYRGLHPWLPAAWRPLPRPPAARPVPPAAPGPPVASVFVGCIAASYEGPARAALLRLAGAAGLKLQVPPGQGCCGAAAAHCGEAAAAARLGAANAQAFAGAGPVLCLASGCQSTLAGSLRSSAPVADAMVFLAAHAERLRFRSAAGLRVALHRPCTQFALPGSIAAMRALLARVPGLELVELPDTGCCGAAGMHMVEFPERASALRSDVLASLGGDTRVTEALRGQPCVPGRASLGGVTRVAEALRGQPCVPGTQILSASLGCRLHLANGSLLPMRHPLEFLAEMLE